MNIFQRIFDAIKHLIQRPGLKRFLARYEEQAFTLITGLAQVNSNAAFGVWKDQAFTALKGVTQEVHDNWIAILIHLAYESYKAQQDESPSALPAPAPPPPAVT